MKINKKYPFKICEILDVEVEEIFYMCYHGSKNVTYNSLWVDKGGRVKYFSEYTNNIEFLPSETLCEIINGDWKIYISIDQEKKKQQIIQAMIKRNKKLFE